MSKSSDTHWRAQILRHAIDLICTGHPSGLSEEKLMQWFDETGMYEAHLLSHFLSRYDTVLDFGGGIGRVAKHVSKLVKEVTVCDISKDMLTLGENEWCQGIDNIKWINNTTNIPFPDNTFDVVYSLLCFFHLFRQTGDEVFWVQEMRRILKPNGLLYFDTWEPRDVNTGMTLVRQFDKYPEDPHKKTQVYVYRKNKDEDTQV